MTIQERDRKTLRAIHRQEKLDAGFSTATRWHKPSKGKGSYQRKGKYGRDW